MAGAGGGGGGATELEWWQWCETCQEHQDTRLEKYAPICSKCGQCKDHCSGMGCPGFVPKKNINKLDDDFARRHENCGEENADPCICHDDENAEPPKEAYPRSKPNKGEKKADCKICAIRTEKKSALKCNSCGRCKPHCECKKKKDLVEILSQSVMALHNAFDVMDSPFDPQPDATARCVSYHLNSPWRKLKNGTIWWDHEGHLVEGRLSLYIDAPPPRGEGYGFWRSKHGVSIISEHIHGLNDTVYHVFSNANERPDHPHCDDDKEDKAPICDYLACKAVDLCIDCGFCNSAQHCSCTEVSKKVEEKERKKKAAPPKEKKVTRSKAQKESEHAKFVEAEMKAEDEKEAQKHARMQRQTRSKGAAKPVAGEKKKKKKRDAEPDRNARTKKQKQKQQPAEESPPSPEF